MAKSSQKNNSLYKLALTKGEFALFKKLSTPVKIQNFLDSVPINWEKRGETYMSPRRALQTKKMHCFEGALFAAAALWVNGQAPLIMDLKAKGDDDHVVALYRINNYWGAISKTNHATLRWRDPVYKNLRELALSYFHEYFKNSSGRKCLVSYAGPINLRRFGYRWVTEHNDLDDLVEAVDAVKHIKLYPPKQAGWLRPADRLERQAGQIIEWPKNHPRT